MGSTERFAELMAAPESSVAPDEMALLIAAHARTGADVEVERTRIDHLAEGCREATVDGIRSHLFGELGFRGDTARYHEPRNSLIDQVVTRRLGNPITLSVLTIGVARRVGVSLVGIGMPGHFLVADPGSPDRFLDPFGSGALLDTPGCEARFRALHGPSVPFHPSYLQPVGARAVVARMLANLKAGYASSNDQRSLLWVLRLRRLVPGTPPGERVEMAAVLSAIGNYGEAARELEALAALTDDRSASTRYARQAEQLRARLN